MAQEFLIICRKYHEKGKLVESRGRKATDLKQENLVKMAGLPYINLQRRFYFIEMYCTLLPFFLRWEFFYFLFQGGVFR